MAGNTATDLETQSTLQAILGVSDLQNDITAKKALEDLFSGSPTNAVRALKLYNEALNGNAFVNSDLGNASANSKSAQAKKRDKTSAAVLDNLLQMVATEQAASYINDLQASAKQRIEEAKSIIEQSRETLQEVEDGADELLERGFIDHKTHTQIHTFKNEEEGNINDLFKQLDEQQTRLEDQGEALATGLEKMPDTEKKTLVNNTLAIAKQAVVVSLDIAGNKQNVHILHKDEENGGYYVIHPTTGDRITIDNNTAQAAIGAFPDGKLANDLPKGTVTTFNDNTQSLLHSTKTPEVEAIINSIYSGFSSNIQANIEIESIRLKIEDTALRINQINQIIKHTIDSNQEMSAEDQARIYDLTQEKEELKLAIRDSFNKATTSILDEENITIDTLARYEEDLESLYEHEERSELQQLSMIDFGGRHEQLEEKYGGFLNNIAEVFADDDDIKYALKEIEEGSFTGSAAEFIIGEDLINAWKNPIQHEGLNIYRDDKTGELYTYADNKEENGIRMPIQDIDTIRSIYEQAYGENPKLFMNETPYSSQFNSTLDALLDAEKMNAQIDDNVRNQIIAERQQREAQIENLQQGKQALKEDNAFTKDLSNIFDQHRNAQFSPVEGSLTGIFSSQHNALPHSPLISNPQAPDTAKGLFGENASDISEDQPKLAQESAPNIPFSFSLSRF